MIDWILGIIGTIFYPLFCVILLFLDGIQSIFYAFAGIGGVEIGDWTRNGNMLSTSEQGIDADGGIVYFLFQHELVKNMLISIMLLAIFLIIIFTVMAFIKNVYAAKQKGWKEIVGNAIKGLANFIFIPVCCLLGVWLGNILLQAINGATSSGGSTQMSRKLFIASAYNANVFRMGNFTKLTHSDVTDFAGGCEILSGPDAGKKYTEVYEIKNHSNQDGSIDSVYYDYYADVIDKIHSETDASLVQFAGIGTVAKFYATYAINYLVLVVGGVFMLYVLCSLAFAMVRRMFILLTLFIISPGICAMYPLDEGKAVGKWKDEFIKQVLSAYGAVAGLNIFFSLIPLIDQIHLGGWANGVLVDELIQIFILVSGLLVVKELISLISGFVGGEDAYSKGASLMSSTRSAMKKYGGGTVNKVTGAFASAKGKAAAGDGSTFGNLMRGALKGGLNAATSVATGGVFDPKAMKKQYDDSYKSGKESAFKNYDLRSKDERKTDEDEFEKLTKDKKKKIDQTDMLEFLNSVKDDKAKEKYAEQFAAHNNRIASKGYEKKVRMDNGVVVTNIETGKPVYEKVTTDRKLSSGSKYIEAAKAEKEYQDKTLPAQAKSIQSAYDKQETARQDYLDAEKERRKARKAFDDKMTIGGGLHIQGFSPEMLQQMFANGQKIDLKEVKGGTISLESATAFNEMVDRMAKSEQKVESAAERRKSAEDAVTEAVNAAKETIKEFAESAKVKIDTDELDKAVGGIAKAAEDISKLSEEVRKTKDSLKTLQDNAKKTLSMQKLKK